MAEWSSRSGKSLASRMLYLRQGKRAEWGIGLKDFVEACDRYLAPYTQKEIAERDEIDAREMASPLRGIAAVEEKPENACF